MTKVVAVSALEPNATGTGKAVVWSGLWRELARHAGGQISYIVVGETAGAAFKRLQIEGTNVDTYRISRPKGLEQAINLVGAVLQGRPFQEAALGGQRVRQELRKKVSDLAPDLLLIDTYRLGVHLTKLSGVGRTVLYLEDLFSVRYERMLEATALRPGLDVQPLGNFAAVLPPVVEKVVAQPRIRDFLLRSEARRVRRTEIEAPARFDLSLLVNPDEVGLLRQLSGCNRVEALPPRVKLTQVGERRPPRDAANYVFLGALNVPHNEAGLTTFFREALPTLLQRQPAAKVTVVGRGASSELLELGTAFEPNVEFVGYVEDLDSLMSEATAMIVPLVFGSGIKIKVLEALGRGVPVVATSFGAEGLARSKEGNDGLYVAEAWDEFIDYAVSLTDAEANRVASMSARQHFLRHYSAEAIAPSYDLVPKSAARTST